MKEELRDGGGGGKVEGSLKGRVGLGHRRGKEGEPLILPETVNAAKTKNIILIMCKTIKFLQLTFLFTIKIIDTNMCQ